jgi:uncharacterized membrane protein
LARPLQLAYWFCRRHYSVHRRLGRILLGAGLLTGASAVVIGVLFPFGGRAEMSATVLFGAWFGVCLVLAFRAIRVDDIVRHRHWMTRAFAIGIGVGTIRIWIALFQVTGLLTFPAAFSPDHDPRRVTMDAIAREAGVGRATLYRRYPDPHSIAVALLDEHERRVQEKIISGEPPLGPVRHHTNGWPPSTTR